MAHARQRAADEASNVPLGLDIALEYIGFENLIDDEYTLRSGRLVNRSWRLSKTFSSKIKSATLHTLADVKLAASLLPRASHQPSPSCSVEEISVFPNLTTLYLPGYLVSQLGKSSRSIDLLASMKNIEIHVLDVSVDSWESQQMSTLRKLARIGCSLQLNWGKDLASFMSRGGSSVYAHLTELKLPNIAVEESLSQLSVLSALRHLHLPQKLIHDESPNLSSFLNACAGLTQLTRLDFLNRGNAKGTNFLAEYLALEAVRALEYDFFRRGFLHLYSFDWHHIHATFTHGLLNAKRMDCRGQLYMPRDHDTASSILFDILKHSDSVTDFFIYIEPGEEKFYISLQIGSGLRHHLSVDFECSEASNGGEHMGNGLRTSLSHTGLSKVPVADASHGCVQVSSQFVLRNWQLDVADLTNIAVNLPTLFPALQDLDFHAESDASLFLEQIAQLTKLTSLNFSLKPSHPSYASLPPLSLPPSLRELSIYVRNLDYIVLSNLLHVTKLMVIYHREGDATLDPLYHLRAPLLKDLDLSQNDYLSPLELDLAPVARAFPLLESLNVKSNSYDLSPLAGLKRLRNLKISLPDSVSDIVTGTETLTSLAHLDIRSGNECLASLRGLLTLTQLKSLKYRMSIMSLNQADSEDVVEHEGYDSRLVVWASDYLRLKQQIRIDEKEI